MRRSIARTASYEDTNKDDFPTPPWATRAFFEYVAPELMLLNKKTTTFHDPCCGRGHMVMAVRGLGFSNVNGSDIRDYGNRYAMFDYLGPTGRGWQFRRHDSSKALHPRPDYYCANPPYKRANDFVEMMLKQARRGVALLVRTNWVEGGREHDRSRWARILCHNPPTRIAVISGRMPAAHGKVVRRRAVFVSHSWFYWDLTRKSGKTEFRWIPPEAQRLLERPEDYK